MDGQFLPNSLAVSRRRWNPIMPPMPRSAVWLGALFMLHVRDEVGALAMENLRQGIFTNTIDRFDSLIPLTTTPIETNSS